MYSLNHIHDFQKSDWIELNIPLGLGKRLRDEIKLYRLQSRTNEARRSASKCEGLDALARAALEGKEIEEFDLFE